MTNSFSGDAMTTGPERRSVWQLWPLRLVFFFLVLATIDIGCMVVPAVLTHSIGKHADPVVLMGACAVAVVLMIFTYRLLVQVTERRSPDELQIRKSVLPLAAGAVIGIGLFCLAYAAMAFCGVVSITGFGTTAGLGVALATSIYAAVGEEIIFRGVIYRLFEEGFGTFAAIVVSGAIFGLIHAFNPGATLVSTLAIAFEAGILLAAAYAMSRSLWLPIGLHFGWNFTEGGIFSAAVSGGHAHGLIATTFSGPPLLTGGAFGPEASIPAVAVCVAAALVMLVRAARRGEWKPMRFRFRIA
jgi:membrane protease YdiL (CAAX protease family)